MPETLSELALDNAVLLYNLLFTAASQALLFVGRAYSPLRAETGFIAVLHTWGQLLWAHVHLHVLWIGGGLARDGSGWRALPTGFCLPKEWLREEFRFEFLAGLQRTYDNGTFVLRGRHGHLFAPAAFAAWIEELKAKTWNLHAEAVDLGHETDQTPAEAAQRTLGYLARYASGVALSHERLIAIAGDEVEFSYKDYRDHGRRKVARLEGVEFLERFLWHVLPPGLRHIRHYGFLAPNKRGEQLPRIRALLGCGASDTQAPGRTARPRKRRTRNPSTAVRGVARGASCWMWSGPVRRWRRSCASRSMNSGKAACRLHEEAMMDETCFHVRTPSVFRAERWRCADSDYDTLMSVRMAYEGAYCGALHAFCEH